MPTMTDTVTREQWEIAGKRARAWSIQLRAELEHASRPERRELWDDILDGALADAGIIPDRLPAFPVRCVVCNDQGEGHCSHCPAV